LYFLNDNEEAFFKTNSGGSFHYCTQFQGWVLPFIMDNQIHNSIVSFIWGVGQGMEDLP